MAPDPSDYLWLRCSNVECKSEFRVTYKSMHAARVWKWQDNDSVKCPACEQAIYLADRFEDWHEEVEEL